MSRKLTACEFISRATSVHGNTYDYSRVEYVSDRVKVEIVCKLHGSFFQIPSSHTSAGAGCPVCGMAGRVESKEGLAKKASEAFIGKATKIHHNRYDYSKTEYTKSASFVTITCPVHGDFQQTSNNHLAGHGCPKCGFDTGGGKRSDSKSSAFAARSNAVHPHKYNYSQAVYVKSKAKVSILCPRHGVFTQTPESHLQGKGCPSCVGGGPSKAQIEIYEFIRSLGFDAKLNHVIPGSRKEIDIWIPSASLGVEFDGVYWHSELHLPKHYHAEKINLAAAAGINLVQIFSSQWKERPEQWKSLISYRLGISSRRVFARRCEVSPLTYLDCYNFFEDNHVQGGSNRGDGYGLFDGDKLVAAMSFSNVMSSRGVSPSSSTFEMLRFATSLSVPGAAGRLLSKFIKCHPSCRRVVTYSDNRAFSGNMYKTLGFRLDEVMSPDYAYTVEGQNTLLKKKLFSHALMPKTLGANYDPSKTEHENALANGYLRVYDSGKKRWVLDL